jgi:hypothetical protein
MNNKAQNNKNNKNLGERGEFHAWMCLFLSSSEAEAMVPERNLNIPPKN